jgi:glycosyltransferase involved in cell wall biosynthesis
LIARVQPHFVHSHNLGALIYSGIATFGGMRRPLLQGEHAHLTAEERSPRRLRQRRWLYRACAAIHTVSAPMRDELLSLGFPAEKITVIPNGVDIAQFAPGDRSAARHSFELPADALVIGIVGRFGPFKRHAVLLDAFDLLARQFPSLHLLIAGTGGSEEQRVSDRAAASPHRDRIRLAGYQADPRACYRALDLLAVPSTNEGMSNAALEAMASGVPVLGNAGCGHEQIVTHDADGVIADLASADALAAQLRLLLSSPVRLSELGLAARKKIETHFSIEHMVSGYERLYRRLAPHAP